MDAMNETLYERLGGREKLVELLRHFYADVRQHSLIGPIFNTHIKDWPAHIEKIANFWSNLTGGPMLYGGGMAARHMPLGLKEEHFQAWLGLWEHNCRTRLSADCAEEMIKLAQDIGKRLRQITGVERPKAWPGTRGLTRLELFSSDSIPPKTS